MSGHGPITKGTYIEFHDVGVSESGKTRRFEVRDRSGMKLGWVSWYPRWRKYIYQPAPRTVYEEVCLREIAEFVQSETKMHKQKESII